MAVSSASPSPPRPPSHIPGDRTTVRDQLWDAPADKLKSMSALCTAMSE